MSRRPIIITPSTIRMAIFFFARFCKRCRTVISNRTHTKHTNLVLFSLSRKDPCVHYRIEIDFWRISLFPSIGQSAAVKRYLPVILFRRSANLCSACVFVCLFIRCFALHSQIPRSFVWRETLYFSCAKQNKPIHKTENVVKRAYANPSGFLYIA